MVAEVFEAFKHHKPIYIKSRGVPKGVFVRVGQGDQRVTDRELADLYRERDSEGYDETEVRGSRAIRDVSKQAVSLYRKVNLSLTNLIPDDRELLFSLSCLREDEPDSALSVAGLLLFGNSSALRRYAPSARIDFIEVPGRQWDPKADDRYITVEIREPLLLAIPKLVGMILESIPKRLTLPKGELFREETPLLPSEVLREAVVNAVMHRCYLTKSRFR